MTIIFINIQLITNCEVMNDGDRKKGIWKMTAYTKRHLLFKWEHEWVVIGFKHGNIFIVMFQWMWVCTILHQIGSDRIWSLNAMLSYLGSSICASRSSYILTFMSPKFLHWNLKYFSKYTIIARKIINSEIIFYIAVT